MQVLCFDSEAGSLFPELPFGEYQVVCSLVGLLSQLPMSQKTALLVGIEGAALAPALPDFEISVPDPDFRTDAELPYGDGEFACVIAADILDRVPDAIRTRFLTELARIAADLVIVVGPFASEINSAAEESLNEIHRAACGTPHPLVQTHLEEGLPAIKATRDRLAQHGIQEIAVFPHTSLRSWAMLQMLETLAGGDERTSAMFSRLNAFYNIRLARNDHAMPVYRHVLVGSRHAGTLEMPLLRKLKELFSTEGREREMESVRELLRVVLDSYAEALAIAPPKGVLHKTMQRLEELERRTRSQARTIEKLNNELYLLRNSRNGNAPVRLLKKLFTF